MAVLQDGLILLPRPRTMGNHWWFDLLASGNGSICHPGKSVPQQLPRCCACLEFQARSWWGSHVAVKAHPTTAINQRVRERGPSRAPPQEPAGSFWGPCVRSALPARQHPPAPFAARSCCVSNPDTECGAEKVFNSNLWYEHLLLLPAQIGKGNK